MHECGNYHDVPCSRRDMLSRCAAGFGSVALAGLLADRGFAGMLDGSLPSPHHPARARSVIFLYMDGGPSQVDTFDPKPRLSRLNGQPFPMEMARTQFNDNGAVLASPWKFKQHGHCGAWVSELFPHTATCVDELCIVRSMTSEFSEHTNANYFLHTGLGIAGRPSMGAWASYGLGSENSDLPGFVVLNGGLTPPGGLQCFGNGFLPATHQGTVIQPRGNGMANVTPIDGDHERMERRHELLRQLDQRHAAMREGDDAIERASVGEVGQVVDEILVAAGIGPTPAAKRLDRDAVRSGAFPSSDTDGNVVPCQSAFLCNPETIPLLPPVWEIVEQHEQ